MEKTNMTNKLTLLNCIFITSLLVANVCAAKVVTFWGLVIPAAIVAYPITFLITDVIGELYGKDEANKTVRIGFICQLISLLLLGISILLPVAPFADNQAQYQSIIGNSFRVVAASMIAYICSQSWDVFVFHKLKNLTSDRHKWLRNNLSTMTSQIIDTAIFITIAFYGTVPSLIVMILSQYLIKVIYAAIDTPFFYLLTKKKDNKKRK